MDGTYTGEIVIIVGIGIVLAIVGAILSRLKRETTRPREKPVSVGLFIVLGLLGIVWGLLAWIAGSSAIHEIQAEIAIGFGLLLMAVAGGARHVGDTIRDLQADLRERAEAADASTKQPAPHVADVPVVPEPPVIGAKRAPWGTEPDPAEAPAKGHSAPREEPPWAERKRQRDDYLPTWLGPDRTR